jgi:hypothetical protein
MEKEFIVGFFCYLIIIIHTLLGSPDPRVALGYAHDYAFEDKNVKQNVKNII